MNYVRVTVGDYAENCYILYNDKNEGVLIDPGADPERIDRVLNKYEVKLQAVLLTHGHFDHIGAVDYLKKKYGIKVYSSEAEAAVCEDPRKNSSIGLGEYAISLTPDEYFTDGQVLPLLDGEIKAILTPGHTIGGACFYVKSMGRVFSGDTLFLRAVGRYDLPTGNGFTLQKSIREQLFTLPEDTKVSPGHGLETSIGQEKMFGTDDFC